MTTLWGEAAQDTAEKNDGHSFTPYATHIALTGGVSCNIKTI